MLGAEVPVSAGGSYGPVYRTFAELLAASELVVIGEVTSQVSLGVPDAAEDPNADEYFRLAVGIDRTLKGAPEPTDEVTIAWDAFVTEITDGGTWASGGAGEVDAPRMGRHIDARRRGSPAALPLTDGRGRERPLPRRHLA
ncbi:MAG: hypothetical protein M5T61_02665 [Acidimicrobiia bacterium]|nr:hypothetical protein [Acidimicrobiia bacterium]